MKTMKNLKIGNYIFNIEKIENKMIVCCGTNINIDHFCGVKKFKNLKSLIRFTNYINNFANLNFLAADFGFLYGDYFIGFEKNDEFSYNFEFYNTRELGILYDEEIDEETEL